MTEEQITSDRKLKGKSTNLFLKILLAVTVFMVTVAILFHLQIPLEIIGLTGFVLAFWLITEAMGWKSTATHDEFYSSVGSETDGFINRMFQDQPQTYAVFHNIDTGYGYIEHVVLSKEQGLFIIETKQHSGKVICANSQLIIDNLQPEQDFFAKILWNSFWLRERIKASTMLEITVTPIVVFLNATVDVTEPVNGVIVTNRDSLQESIQKVKADPHISASLWAIHESGAIAW